MSKYEDWRREFYRMAGELETTLRFYKSPFKRATNPHGIRTIFWHEGIPYDTLEIFNITVFGETDVAKKKNTYSVEFVNTTLSKEERKEFETWFSSKGETITRAVHTVLEGQTKLGLSYNPDTKSFTCSATGKEDSLNPNKCMTSHAPTWFQALALTVYKCEVVHKGGVWEGEDSEDWG